jgi:rhodanese-related sulfurtransferase
MSGVDEALEQSRAGCQRLTPEQAWAELAAGALLVDTRTAAQRSRQGELPGALVIDRTVLEWRLDPTSSARIPEAADASRRVIVICRQGYSSSFAAESLRRIGLSGATDVIGGVEAWLAAGLPLSDAPADVRE